MVRALVSVCPESVNDIDYGSRTPLHYAARKGRVAVATHLLESGAAADYRYKFITETFAYLLFKQGSREDLLQIPYLFVLGSLDFTDSEYWVPFNFP